MFDKVGLNNQIEYNFSIHINLAISVHYHEYVLHHVRLIENVGNEITVLRLDSVARISNLASLRT
jgi:hypothetical protein